MQVPIGSPRSACGARAKRGEFAPCDAALVACAILAALNWSARWYWPDGVHSVAAIARGAGRLPGAGDHRRT
ncbi:MAG: hypothetical protein HY848_03375 [Betaproteobacteria bacterium]|nr:hypothetical protein [Betaproteobacteria bacterium]